MFSEKPLFRKLDNHICSASPILITKLKLVKRQMYGRGKLDLLQARVMAPHNRVIIKIASAPRLDADHPENGVLIPRRITASLCLHRSLTSPGLAPNSATKAR